MTGQRPSATRLPFPISNQIGASVDVGTGNLELSTQGLNIPGVNGVVPIGATYNSMSTNVGSNSTLAATGWNFSLDSAGALSIVAAPGNIVYTAADGTTWVFTPVSGSTTAFASPAGFKSTLVAQLSSGAVSGYALTASNSGQVVTFDTTGNPTKVADRNSNTTTILVTTTPYTTNTTVTSPAGPVAARKATLVYTGWVCYTDR